MKHESYERIFVVEDTQISFETWFSKPYISPSLRSQLKNANLLIVPDEGIRETIGPVFPEGTAELFRFLKECSEEGLISEICIEDNNYNELALHWDLVNVGTVVATLIVAPVAVNLISEYLKKWLGPKEEKTHIKFDMTIVESKNKSTHILYEGPAKEFKDTLSPVIKSLANCDMGES